MKITRRKFIGAASLAAGIVVSGEAVLGQTHGPPDLLEQLDWDAFLPYMYTDFSFGGIGVPEAVLRLDRMEDTRPAGISPKVRGKECFMLTFKGSRRTPLVQGTYEIEHFALGSFQLFITVGRVTPADRDISYYAVINRYIPANVTAGE